MIAEIAEELDVHVDENGRLEDIFGDDVSDDAWCVREQLREHSSTGGKYA